MKINLSLLKVILLGCIAVTTAMAQNENPKAAPATVQKPRFDITIHDGVLFGSSTNNATIENIVAELRVNDPDLNIVVTPGVKDVSIQDLKMRVADLTSVMEALTIASSGSVRGSRLNDNTWAIMSPHPRDVPSRDVEVFNLSGYLQHFTTDDEKKIALEKLKEVIVDTLSFLLTTAAKREEALPSFRFHPGASLFIVVGSREAIDVTRKVVTALPGQIPVAETSRPSKAF